MDRDPGQDDLREVLFHFGILLAASAVVTAVVKLLGWSGEAHGTALILVLGAIIVLYPPMTRPRSKATKPPARG